MLEAAKVLSERGRPRYGGRAFDVCVALVLIILAAPLFAAVALAVLLDGGRPIFYRCTRVGRDGREFRLLKFRKMHPDAAGLPLTVRDDERFTRAGRMLARHKLDELPQLWNVLCGDMSVVGPRPEAAEFVAAEPRFATILEVRPGITGLCQLAYADEGSILSREQPIEDYLTRILPQKLRLDQLYVQRRSLALDLRILAWTFAAVALRMDVAVNREDARLGRRRPRATEYSSPSGSIHTSLNP